LKDELWIAPPDSPEGAHVAHEGGLGRSFAGAIERGEKDIRLSTLTKLARTLGVSLSQLLKGIGS
jgi:transcriptional regulator with XRE-family HTH domain